MGRYRVSSIAHERTPSIRYHNTVLGNHATGHAGKTIAEARGAPRSKPPIVDA